jgi:hypothetical protein
VKGRQADIACFPAVSLDLRLAPPCSSLYLQLVCSPAFFGSPDASVGEILEVVGPVDGWALR